MLIFMFFVFRIFILEVLLAPEKVFDDPNDQKVTDRGKRLMKLLAGYITHVLCLDFNNLCPIIPRNTALVTMPDRLVEPTPANFLYGRLG